MEEAHKGTGTCAGSADGIAPCCAAVQKACMSDHGQCLAARALDGGHIDGDDSVGADGTVQGDDTSGGHACHDCGSHGGAEKGPGKYMQSLK